MDAVSQHFAKPSCKRTRIVSVPPLESRNPRSGLRAFACLAAAGALCLVARVSSATPKEVEARVRRVEQGLLPAVLVHGEKHPGMLLEDRMRRWNVPGLSIAVIDRGSIAWARGYGVTEAGGTDSVTAETAFQAGSVSKPVAAMAALQLVESGALGLDQDVNRSLTTWRIPASDSSAGIQITLRMLLTHSAGLTVHGFPGYAIGDSMPSLTQVLDGLPPANTPPIRVDMRPGRAFRYSGGGFCVVQQLLTDVAGGSYPDLMAKTVLRPLGMDHSSFDQPREEVVGLHRAAGHAPDGSLIQGKWHRYPELAAAGLWTTPTDLAKLALDVQKGWRGSLPHVFSSATVRAMLSPQITPTQGLGWRLAGRGQSARFEHSGDTDGFACAVVGYLEHGQGAVVMTNGSRGENLVQEVMRSIAKEYGWQGYLPPERRVVDLPESTLARHIGRYALDVAPNVFIDVAADHDSLSIAVIQPSGTERGRVLPESPDRFFERESGIEITFFPGTGSSAKSCLIRQGSETYRATQVR